MDPAQYQSLPALISPARLEPYLRACEQDMTRALRLYTWNVEVSCAFWGAIHVLEVSLRNAEHQHMSTRYGRADWWSDPAVALHAVMRDQVTRAQDGAAKSARKNRRDVVADDVVAALPFGFWSGLLAPGGSAQYETRYWQPFLHRAFPQFDGPRSRLYRDVDSLRLLRNRLAHHEPIFGRHLAADHVSILRVAHYIAPDISEFLDSHSRVPGSLARREQAVAAGRGTRL